jgi:hypothetical protein
VVIGIADGAFSADDKTTRIAGTSWGSWVHGGYAAGTRFTRGSVSTTARRAHRWLTRPVWGSVHGFRSVDAGLGRVSHHSELWDGLDTRRVVGVRCAYSSLPSSLKPSKYTVFLLVYA